MNRRVRRGLTCGSVVSGGHRPADRSDLPIVPIVPIFEAFRGSSLESLLRHVERNLDTLSGVMDMYGL